MLDAVKEFFSTRISPERQAARALYDAVVAAGRAPDLYARGGVPDTVEGRLDCIALHAFLLFRRMSGKAGWDDIGGALSDEIVADFDRSLREMGVGDMSVGKKVQKAAQVFFGRFDAYWGAVTESDGAEDLQTVLRRAVFQDTDPEPAKLSAMMHYIDRQSAFLDDQDEAAILAGRVSFADPAVDFESLPLQGEPK